MAGSISRGESPMHSHNLDALVRDAGARITEDNITVVTDPLWAAEGESRIGYAGLIRLAECGRELHWRRLLAEANLNQPIDSITRKLEADFTTPVPTSTVVEIRSNVRWLRTTSYGLDVELSLPEDGLVAATIGLVSVIIDPETLRPISPPDTVRNLLERGVVR